MKEPTGAQVTYVAEGVIGRGHVQVHEFLKLGHADGCPAGHPGIKRAILELCRKFLPIDLAVPVVVNLLQDLIHFPGSDAEIELSHGVSELYLGDKAVAILIKLVEDLSQ